VALRDRRPAGLSGVGQPDAASNSVDSFDPDFIRGMREIAASGLNPSSALDLIVRLIAEVPAASREAMDRIKMLDKLLNTARAMMETRLKNEDAAEIAARLDQMEMRMQELLNKESEAESRPLEVWHAGKREE
jgi:hypothetical protein